MTRLRRSFAMSALAACLVLLGACTTSTSSGAKVPTKGKSATTTAAGSSTTTKLAGTSSTATSGGDDVQVSGSYCDMIKQLNAKSGGLFTPAQGNDPASTLKSLQQNWANYMDIVHQIQAKAPAEIKADVDFRVKQFETLNARIQKLTSYSSADVSSIMGTTFSDPEAKKHNDVLDAYDKDTCGIDPNADSSGSDTSS